MKLLLDLGNTRLKWAFATDTIAPVAQPSAWATDDLAARLVEAWSIVDVPSSVLGACVTSASRRARIEDVLSELAWPSPRWLSSPARHGGVVNAYTEPAQLGIDRFLAMLAARHAGLAPCVIAGCGSALTLDALGADGRHHGGLIAAGVAAMRHGLAHIAPGLPDPTLDTDVDITDNTADAVAAGAWQAAAGAIERFAVRQRRILGTDARVVLTGGDASKLAGMLDATTTLLPDAVLAGLSVWNAPDRQRDNAG